MCKHPMTIEIYFNSLFSYTLNAETYERTFNHLNGSSIVGNIMRNPRMYPIQQQYINTENTEVRSAINDNW